LHSTTGLFYNKVDELYYARERQRETPGKKGLLLSSSRGDLTYKQHGIRLALGCKLAGSMDILWHFC
jgi:hypothetical protein